MKRRPSFIPNILSIRGNKASRRRGKTVLTGRIDLREWRATFHVPIFNDFYSLFDDDISPDVVAGGSRAPPTTSLTAPQPLALSEGEGLVTMPRPGSL